jgi:WD40 repeat protein
MEIWPGNAKSSATLSGHEREIYTVRWRPAGLAERLLVETAKCVKKFPRRKQPVYAIEFSPDGAYCVIGSFDRTIEVFHVDSGRCVQVVCV